MGQHPAVRHVLLGISIFGAMLVTVRLRKRRSFMVKLWSPFLALHAHIFACLTPFSCLILGWQHHGLL